MRNSDNRGWIKVCGITTVADAELLVEAGASAIGLNLWPSSPRSVALPDAVAIADAVRTHIEIISVTVDAAWPDLLNVQQQLRPHRMQLHGSESDATLERLGADAYKGIGLGDAADVQRAQSAPGAIVLVDARDDTRRGGTGQSAPSPLVVQVCRARATVLAGGLGADNVAAAIAQHVPWGVDAASRLELRPGVKNPELVRQFVQCAKEAFASGAPGEDADS